MNLNFKMWLEDLQGQEQAQKRLNKATADTIEKIVRDAASKSQGGTTPPANGPGTNAASKPEVQTIQSPAQKAAEEKRNAELVGKIVAGNVQTALNQNNNELLNAMTNLVKQGNREKAATTKSPAPPPAPIKK